MLTFKKDKDLTPEQKSTLQFIFNCAKRVKKKLESSEDLTEEEQSKLKEEYSGYRKEFSEVYSARDTYNHYIELADHYLTLAEHMKEEWGFTNEQLS